MGENGAYPRRLDGFEIAEGLAVGSCGAALVVRPCIAKSASQGTSTVRTLQAGQLIQVWKNFDNVYFSYVDVRGQDVFLDPLCFTAKQNDIKLVPGLLWAALIPLEPQERAAFVSTRQLERFSSIGVDSVVEVLNADDEILAQATVVFKGMLPGFPGLYYGVSFGADVKYPWDIVTLIPALKVNTDAIPRDCHAIVTVRQIQPLGSVIQRLIDFPKSNSHDALKSATFCPPPSRRQQSRSLDLTNSSIHSSSGNHLSKIHSTSRSLELTNSNDRKLLRGRACSSLDNDSSLTARVPVLTERWPEAEAEEECWYDVPRDVPRRINHGRRPPPSTEFEDNCQDDITVGSLVEIRYGSHLLFGLVHWIGLLPDTPRVRVAGVELEEELEEDNGTLGLFECPPYRALFVPLAYCTRDSRFQDKDRKSSRSTSNAFGQIECPIVEGTIPPITRSLGTICGKNRGIQGHHNSCYLDATLCAMFAFTSVFDSLLYRPPNGHDVAQYEQVQCVLRNEIVNPLRKNLFVRADRVMKLRTLLEELSSVTGLTSEEKDPEEFLNSLLTQILKAEPFLQLSSGHEAFHHQLFVEKDESLGVPSVQQLLEQSFLASDIKLKLLPPCLIIQMPRFGKAFKMYPRILPSNVLDVTDVIDNSPRQCTICGELAELECRDCYLAKFEGSSFCSPCLDVAHNHPTRRGHSPRHLTVPSEFRELQEHCVVPRLVMNLFAVVCIETSHYVSFLKTDHGWVFFDSMADRKGEQNGYNIPEIVPCPELPDWLNGLPEVPDDRHLPELAKRLLCDAYMCMYQSSEVLMYR